MLNRSCVTVLDLHQVSTISIDAGVSVGRRGWVLPCWRECFKLKYAVTRVCPALYYLRQLQYVSIRILSWISWMMVAISQRPQVYTQQGMLDAFLAVMTVVVSTLSVL